ncbi:MAG: hypothetical protein HZC10_04135, partial [Nitrospirae bacterium]|nr:hypothetical protein [Nitrospirota bacterium]
ETATRNNIDIEDAFAISNISAVREVNLLGLYNPKALKATPHIKMIGIIKIKYSSIGVVYSGGGTGIR